MIDISFVKILIEEFGFYSIIIPLLITAAVFTLPKFVDSTTYFKARKIKYINEALSSDWVDSDSKKILSESISSIYLSSALRIKADRKKVKEIIKIYNILHENFSAIEIYYALRHLPMFFYNLPLDALKERRDKIEFLSKSSKSVVFISTISLSISSMYFIYSLSVAIYNDEFFTRSYLLNDFSFIIGVIISGFILLHSYSEMRRFRDAINILEYYMAGL